MKLTRKRRWLLFALLVLLLGLGCFLIFRPTGPEYNGKTISYWFRQYCGGSGVDEDEKAAEVIKRLGTNALPYLIEQALSTSKDTALRTNVYKLLEKLPDSWHLPEFISHDDLREKAVEAIGEINPAPEMILPLVKDALNSRNPLKYHQAILILATAQTNSPVLAPYLGKALHVEDRDPELESRSDAMELLENLGTNAMPALPDLLWLLERTPGTNLLFVEVAKCLSNLGTKSASAIPQLRKQFDIETNWEECCALAAAIFKIDQTQAGALDFLIKGCSATEMPKGYSTKIILPINSPASGITLDYLRQVPILEIGGVGPTAREAIPALVKVIQSTNSRLWQPAALAISSIGGSSEHVPAMMQHWLTSESPRYRILAASVILELDAGNADAQACLARFISATNMLSLPAMRFIYEKAFPVSDEAKSALKAATASEVGPVNWLATEALKAADVPPTKRRNYGLNWHVD